MTGQDLLNHAHVTDLHNIETALKNNLEFHMKRDEMNAYLHLADPRYSPLTDQTELALNGMRRIIRLFTNTDVCTEVVHDMHGVHNDGTICEKTRASEVVK